ncbi:MAG: class I SAM-dependent methyltransferase [Zoogloeaceae bacterium]|nr:class I SAM-dependent methyltransferase [Zoogloeaceae bacterium]
MSVHPLSGAPSPWVVRWSACLPAGGRVLDFACGGGRHALWLAARGFRVEAADRDRAALRALAGAAGVVPVEADLEIGPWQFEDGRYDAVVVTNYLFRPRLPQLLTCLRPGGVLVYETFMRGNERFGKPSNPDFLLHEGELLALVRDGFSVVAFEQGEIAKPKPAMVQRICAVRGAGLQVRLP